MRTENGDSPRDFDELTYLDLNPDVLRAVLSGQCSSGYEHWMQVGSAEGRLSAPARGLPADWSETRYLRLNPDVADAVRSGTVSSGYDHWKRCGCYEGRPGGQLSRPQATGRGAVSPAGFNIFAFRGANIGLSSAARGYASALHSLLPLHEITVPWNLNGSEQPKLGSLPYGMNLFHMNPDVLPLFFGRYGRHVLPGHFNVGIWVWELHAGYAQWHAQAKLFQEIWTPSNYSADSIRPVSSTPVFVVPHVVDGLPEADLKPAKKNGPFVFLYIFDMASTFERKNPLALIRAFRKTFGNRQDVQLILKYHHTEFDLPAAALLERIGSAAPNIRTISQTLPEAEVYDLLRSCDCFVSPHRSEGFGLNIAEAMYYGKPVIVTGYSGNLDFTTSENAFLIDYELVAVQQESGAYKAGYVWAEPSEDHLAKLLGTVVEAPEEARCKGEQGRKTIRESYSVKAISEIIRERIAAWQL